MALPTDSNRNIWLYGTGSDFDSKDFFITPIFVAASHNWTPIRNRGQRLDGYVYPGTYGVMVFLKHTDLYLLDFIRNDI
jgi:hypothetical protein